MSKIIVKRTYGKEKNFGNIIKTSEGATIMKLSFGALGQLDLTMRKAERGIELLKSYTDKEGNEQSVCLGILFPAKDNNNNVIQGISKATLGLRREYNKELRKNVTHNDDAIFLTTHKLRTPKKMDNGNVELGYITGVFGIEVAGASTQNVDSNSHDDMPQYDDDGEEIAF